VAGKADQMKGKAKEAVGDLTGNKDLKSEGKADRQAGEAKEQVGKLSRLLSATASDTDLIVATWQPSTAQVSARTCASFPCWSSRCRRRFRQRGPLDRSAREDQVTDTEPS